MPKIDPEPASGECILRTIRRNDGSVREIALPATLENLLHLRLEDKLTQSNPHQRTLGPFVEILRRFLERLAPDIAVFSDLQLLYKRYGHRDVSPDVAVVSDLRDRDAVEDSLDVVGEGARLRMVIEVVSTSTSDLRRKDEVENLALFETLGVENHVLVYPPHPERGERLDVEARELDAQGRYRRIVPDARGRLLLRSMDLRLAIDEVEGRLVLQDRRTGKRLLAADEEESARREAEARAVEAESRAAVAEARARGDALLDVLEARGLAMTEAERERIVACREPRVLKRWTRRALEIESVAELWRGEH
jgi:Uma2 family endonuclease